MNESEFSKEVRAAVDAGEPYGVPLDDAMAMLDAAIERNASDPRVDEIVGKWTERLERGPAESAPLSELLARTMKPCPAPGCERATRRKNFCCLPHWDALPAGVRRAVRKHAADDDQTRTLALALRAWRGDPDPRPGYAEGDPQPVGWGAVTPGVNVYAADEDEAVAVLRAAELPAVTEHREVYERWSNSVVSDPRRMQR